MRFIAIVLLAIAAFGSAPSHAYTWEESYTVETVGGLFDTRQGLVAKSFLYSPNWESKYWDVGQVLAEIEDTTSVFNPETIIDTDDCERILGPVNAMSCLAFVDTDQLNVKYGYTVGSSNAHPFNGHIYGGIRSYSIGSTGAIACPPPPQAETVGSFNTWEGPDGGLACALCGGGPGGPGGP